MHMISYEILCRQKSQLKETIVAKEEEYEMG
jgi:hypothetical protein